MTQTGFSVQTNCEMNKNVDYAKADAWKLSTCKVDLLTKLGRYILQNFGSFDFSKGLSTVTQADPTPMKEIALYSVSGIVILLIFALGFCCILYFKPNTRKICDCVRRSETLEPVGYYPELHPLEERSLRVKPNVYQ